MHLQYRKSRYHAPRRESCCSSNLILVHECLHLPARLLSWHHHHYRGLYQWCGHPPLKQQFLHHSSPYERRFLLYVALFLKDRGYPQILPGSHKSTPCGWLPKVLEEMTHPLYHRDDRRLKRQLLVPNKYLC